MEKIQRQQEQLVKGMAAQKAKCRETNLKLQKAEMELAAVSELETAEATNSFEAVRAKARQKTLLAFGYKRHFA